MCQKTYVSLFQESLAVTAVSSKKPMEGPTCQLSQSVFCKACSWPSSALTGTSSKNPKESLMTHYTESQYRDGSNANFQKSLWLA